MDWSAHFDDDGMEPDPLLESRASRDTSHSKYGTMAAYSMTMNYVLGVGALAVPHAFSVSGVSLGLGVMTVTTLFSLLTVHWLVVVCARAQAYNRHTNNTSELLFSSKLSENTAASEKDIPVKYEVTQLCDMYLGRTCMFLYQTSLLFLMYSGLWAYTAVFVNSVSSVVPLKHFLGDHFNQDHLYALLFGLFVIPLSCADLTEQKSVQGVLTGARFFTFALMIVAPMIAMWNDPWSNHLSLPCLPTSPMHPEESMQSTQDICRSMSSDIRDYGHAPYIHPIVWTDWSKFGVIFSTGVFSLLFQHSVPGLIHPLKSKARIHLVFGSVLVSTTVLYVVMGISCAIYFGLKANASINLNWSDFRYGYPPDQDLPTWASFLNLSVIIFPALDTFSVYPLIAITLGSSLEYISKTFAHQAGKNVSGSLIRLCCRLLAAVPPIFALFWCNDIAIIVQYSGVFGVYVAFFTPCMLMIGSKMACDRSGRHGKGPAFETHFSRSEYVYLTFVFAVGSLAMVVKGLL
eukprot:CFRG5322T1